VVDTTGAGDAFAAGLMMALGGGAGMAQALQLASHWGGASVGYHGTVPPPEFPK